MDYYIIGKLNRFSEKWSKIDWPKFRKDAEELLQSYGKMPGEDYCVEYQLSEAK